MSRHIEAVTDPLLLLHNTRLLGLDKNQNQFKSPSE